MTELHIPRMAWDKAYEYATESSELDLAIIHAAPIIVAAELERIAEDGTGWAIGTHLRRRAAELRGE